MKICRLIFSIAIAVIFLTSCEVPDKTQADLDEAYQLGYNDGYAAAMASNTQHQVVEDNSEEVIIDEESGDTAEDNISQSSSAIDNSNSSMVQPQPASQIPEQTEEIVPPVPDIVTVIAAMQSTAPVIDTKTITVYEDGYASDMVFFPGDHIGEYNGVQVDDMFNLSSDAHNEKYYTVTDDLKNVENTLRNADGKTWFDLGYTNCIPIIRYDSHLNKYEENPYDMVHPGWSHSYAIMYSCTWSDGTPRFGVYYIRVHNSTDQEVMAVLCPIESVSDGLNLW